MRRFLGVFVPSGAVLVLFGVVSYALTRRLDLWTAVHLAGGAALVVAGILFDPTRFRRTMTGRGTRERAQAALGGLMFAGLLVAVNVFAARHPWRYDATENKIHTLTPRTEAVLAALQDDVELLVFLEPADPARKEHEDRLRRYGAISAKLTWRIVDAEREPQLADQLGVRRQGVVVARSKGSSAQAAPENGAGLSEGLLTNLVLKVTRSGPKVLYVLSGHGEPREDDVGDPGGLGMLAEVLRADNYEVRPLLLATSATIPGDAAAVLLVGPEKTLLEHESDELAAWLRRGGRALLMLDPGIDAGVSKILDDYRVTLGDDMVVDRQEMLFGGARLGLDPIVEEFLPHAITRDFKERIVLLQARSVEVKIEGGVTGVEAHGIAQTRPLSWAERDWRAMIASGDVTKDDADASGPVTVAVASSAKPAPAPDGTAPAAEAEARVVVIGDSDLARNANLDTLFNRELVLRAVEWLAGREELIVEGPRGLRPSRLDMTQSDFRTLFRMGVLFLPEAFLLVGLAIWWRRRSL